LGESLRQGNARARVFWAAGWAGEALARFLHRNQLPGEKEKNAAGAGQRQLAAPKRRGLGA